MRNTGTTSTTSSIDQKQFTILIERLSILIGFSDGVDDVLDNLLTIESRVVSLDFLHFVVFVAELPTTGTVLSQSNFVSLFLE
jgi:hypothetical protein